MPRFLALFARLFLALVFPLLARATPWRAVDSDLSPHPALELGTLPNGLRYALLPNATPQNRVSLRLLVAVGSLHEADDELGLAHFVEHMAFRGTRTHPAGSLTAALQRLGLGLGPDSAAFTSYESTIYHLELPDTSDATLREGLQVFREYAEELTFDPAALEKERGVVLSEFATRNTPEARRDFENLRFLWPGSRHGRRPIGGTRESLQSLAREQFVAFYDAWYRPERMAVIAVGDIEPARLRAAIEANLGGIQPRGEPRIEPAELTPQKASGPDVGVFSDPGLIGVNIAFQHARQLPAAKDTHAERVAMLHRTLGFMMFHRRLENAARAPDASFLAPLAQNARAFRDWDVATVSVSGKIQDWSAVAGDIEREHRRAFLFGFTARELEEARANLANFVEQSVRSEPTVRSEMLAAGIASSLINGTVFTTAAERKRDLSDALQAATLVDALHGFRSAWTATAPLVYVSANPAFGIARKDIAAALNRSRQVEVKATAETEEDTRFAYEDFGKPGKLAHEEEVPDLEVRLARFENGVRMNFKPTGFEADLVQVRVRIGEGKLIQPNNRPGLDYLANFAVPAGGLGRHTAQELSRVLAGRSLAVNFQVMTDACVFAANTSRRELGLCLQVIAAFLTDAAYRPELMREARASFNTMYAGLQNAPSGPIAMHAWRHLAGGDRRFGIPLYDELFSRDLDDLKTWIEPQFKAGAIELSIVGDTTWEEAHSAVARTLGALPPRRERARSEDPAVQPGPPEAAKIFLTEPTLQQCALAWFWPVSVKDIRAERRHRLLAEVLEERCRVAIRDELGAAYTVSGSLSEAPGFPHLFALNLFTEVPPALTPKANEIIHREALALKKSGVSADEFERVKNPFVRSRMDDLRTNSYWGGTVLSDAQQHPFRLESARTRTADTQAITAAEIAQLAAASLDPAKAHRFVTIPGTAPAPAKR